MVKKISPKTILNVVFVFNLVIFTNSALGQERLWTRIYGHENTQDFPYGLAVDCAGNVVITGTLVPADLPRDFVTAKFTPDGDFLWERIYDTRYIDYAKGLATDDSNNIYVCGFQIAETIPFLGILVKYNSEGSQIWEKFIDLDPFIYGNHARAVAVDRNNNAIVVGWVFHGTEDWFAIKVDQDGNTLWQELYNRDLEERCNAVAVDGENNIILAGYTWNGPDKVYDYWTLKLDTWGNEIWSETYDNDFFDVPQAIAIDSDNNIYVTGYSANDTNFTSPNFESEYLTVKYNPDGDTIWTRTFDYGPSYANDAFGIAVNNSDEVFVTGFCVSNALPYWATIKYSPDGDTKWVLLAPGADASRNVGLPNRRQRYHVFNNPKVATDNDNNFYLFSFTMQGTFYFILHKYRDITAVVEQQPLTVQRDFSLIASNPMSSSRSFSLTVNKTDVFKIAVYNTAGQFVQDVFCGKLVPGFYRFNFAEELNGVYFLLVESENSGIEKQKLIMMK